MAKAAATGGHLCQLLSLFFLLSCLGSSLPADAASLCYDFTIDKAESGLWRPKVQGQLNEETFLLYDSNNNCHVFGGLENILNAINICDSQVSTLKDGLDLLKAEVIHLNLEKNTIRGPLTLQARMCCLYGVDEQFKESCEVGLNGHRMLHFDSRIGEWTEVDPGSSWMKEMWEENTDLRAFLQKTSLGDCRSWLKKLKPLWEKKLVPTAPDVNQQPLSLAIKPNISVLLIILPFLLLLWI